jgi:hypothetical protein
VPALYGVPHALNIFFAWQRKNLVIFNMVKKRMLMEFAAPHDDQSIWCELHNLALYVPETL